MGKIGRTTGEGVLEKEDDLDPREFPKLSICASDKGIGRWRRVASGAEGGGGEGKGTLRRIIPTKNEAQKERRTYLLT